MCLRLGGCLYVIIGGVLKSFPVDGFSAKFFHTFFMSWLNFLIVDQNVFKVRRLPVCNNRWSLKKFSC